MRPVRNSALESIWDQGSKRFLVKKGRDLFSLCDVTSRVWPLVDGERGIETIIAELAGVLEEATIREVIHSLRRENLIKLERDDFRDKVLALYSFYEGQSEKTSPSLMSGSAGSALYFLSEALTRNEERLFKKARAGLISALTGLGQVSGTVSFYEGPLGILWVEKLWRKKTGDALLEQRSVKSFLTNYIERHRFLPPGRYEYLYGTSGWALAAELIPQGLLRSMAGVIVKQIEDALGPCAFGVNLKGVEDLRKFSDPGARLSEFTSPGLAHGLAGALTALIVLRSKDALKRKDLALIDWLSETLLALDHQHPMPRNFESPDQYDRQDWCHGDGGIGLTLLHSGLESRNRNVSEIGIKTLKRALKRLPPKDDIGLCHGLSGKLGLSIIASNLAKGTFDAEQRLLYKKLSYYKGVLNKSLVFDYPLILSAAGAAISLNSLQDQDFMGFYYPLNGRKDV